MTPEEVLKLVKREERKRDKWRRAKARRRKRERDAQWQRHTNSGWFAELEVLHFTHLLECLVGCGGLNVQDVRSQARIDEAIDRLFHGIRLDMTFFPGESTAWLYPPRLPRNRQGTVSLRMDEGIVEQLVRFETERETEKIRRDWCIGRGPRPELVPEFAERLSEDKTALKHVAENWLFLWYSTYVPNPIKVPCKCMQKLDVCDCWRGWNSVVPKPTGRPTVRKRPLKEKITTAKGVSADTRDYDPIVRSHARVARVGMKGRSAGAKARWVVPNAEAAMIRSTEVDPRDSTRDWNATAREAEQEWQRPYDAPTGIPRSWADPSDAEPKDDSGLKRIGSRLVEEATIDPPPDDRPEN